MGLIRVTASELKAKANELRDYNNQFKVQVGKLADQEGILASMWEGEAQAAFRNSFNSDKGQMENFNTLIEQYCQALESIAQKYEQAEAQNAQTASQRTYK